MAIARTTISLEDNELTELQRLASDQGRSLSNFLVACALGIDDSSKLPEYDVNSIAAISARLEKGKIPSKTLEEIRAASPGVADAVMDYQAAANILGTDFQEAVSSQEFFPHYLEYPKSTPETSLRLQGFILDKYQRLADVGSLSTLGNRKSLKTLLSELSLAKDKSGGADESQQEDASVGYHLVRPGLVTRKQVLYLYPFFRPSTRRPLWGIIEYARHASIGLFIKRTLVESKGLTFDSSTPNVAFSSFGDLIYALADAETAPQSPPYKIGFREGCFEEEIGEHMWSHAQTSLRYAFEKFRLPIAAKSLPEILNHPRNECGVVIADLSEGRALDPEVYRVGWDFQKFDHHADVPVGIGFTLSMLPRLLLHDNWRKIQDEVKTHINESKGLRAMFSDCGIELPQQA